MIARVAGPGLAFFVAAAAVWGWVEIGRLRDTPLWEFRYLLLGVATVLALGLVDLAPRRLPGGDA